MQMVVKKISLLMSTTALVVVAAFGIAPIETSVATPAPADIAARITALSGLSPEEIDGMYAVEQRADIIFIATNVGFPVTLDPKIAYLLVRIAATGEWIRVYVDIVEWNRDFRPYLEGQGVEIHVQPKGTIDSVTPAAEAAQLAAVSSVAASTTANLVLYGSPVQIIVPSAPAPAPFANPGPSSVSDQIGTTAGTFRVDESGAATYSIPIAAAAGTAGVAPKITLNYSSAAGNGTAGLGWSLGGLSAISRCRKTVGQDGAAAAINWTNADRFCLDGQRLVLTSGANGANGAVYRNEIDDGTLITVIGSVAGGPDYFKVQRRDGSTAYYGGSPDSSDTQAKLANGANQTLTWALRQFADNVGNPIWFEYETTSQSQRIRNIKFGYGLNRTNPAAAHGARIEFNYEDRSDRTSGFVAGHEFSNDKRLASIKSYNTSGSEKLVREYKLRYGEDHNFTSDVLSRLTSIQECVGSTCLPKTTFTWREPVMSGVYSVSSGFTMANSNHGLRAQRPADINGDGKIDLVWLEGSYGSNASNMNPRLNYAISTNGDFVQQSFVGSSSAYCSGTQQKEICYAKVSSSLQMKLESFDYNADGRSDVAVYDYAASVWKIYLSMPQGDGTWKLSGNYVTSPAADGNLTDRESLFIDVNSDGLVDVLTLQGFSGGIKVRYMERDPNRGVSSNRYYRFGEKQNFSYTSPFWTRNFGFWPIMYNKLDIRGTNADFNGDGRVDFMLTGEVDSYCTIDNMEPGVNFNCAPPEPIVVALVTSGQNSYTKYASFPTWIDKKRIQTVDINADGLTDVVYPSTSNAFYYQLNNGDGTFQARVALNEPTMGQNPDRGEAGADDPQFVDWNLDGYPDIVWKRTSTSSPNSYAYVKIRYWNPTTGSYDAATNWPWMPTARMSENESVMFADMNGDGTPEMTRFNMDSQGHVRVIKQIASNYSSVPANQAVNRIEAITNGFGASTYIDYEPLANTAHYERLNVATTTGTGEFCESEPGFTFCIPVPITVADPDSFYSALNGDWDLPAGSDTLGKYRPVLELNGPIYVVTRIEGDAPAAGLSPGNVNTSARNAISYYYSEAKIQASGRGLLGFERLKTVDEQTGIATTTTYRQDWPFIGYPRKTEVRTTAGHLVSQSVSDWTFLELGSNSRSLAETSGTTALGPVHAVQSLSTELGYDLVDNGTAQGALVKEVVSSTSYDVEANPDVITVTTKDGDGTVIKTVSTDNDYFSTSQLPLREARLSRAEVTTTRLGEANPLVRTTTFNYHTASPHRGLLKDEIVEPGNPLFTTTTTHGYDAFGNKVRSSKTGGGVTRCDVNTSAYDSTGRYPVKTFDCLGRKTGEVVARNEFGAPTNARVFIDASGAFTTTRIAYGALGREYYRHKSDGSSTRTYLTDNLGNCPAGTAYKSTSYAAGGGESEECFDVRGRSIRSLSRGFDGAWDAQDTEYDLLGRVAFNSEPYDISGSPAHWTRLSYDILGRVVSTMLPDGSLATKNYSELTTTITNDLGHKKTEVRNVLGEIVTVIDEYGGQATYQYDHQGNMKRMVDNAGNATVITYDLLGRKRSTADPDKGYWTYTYNHFGELRTQTNANGHTSTMTYDSLGRIKTRTDTCANTSTGNCAGSSLTEGNTIWDYDSAAYGLGQLASVQDTISGYIRVVTYDTLGRASESTTTLDGTTYREKSTFDQYGRAFQVFDAAGDGSFQNNGIQNSYNAYGYLESISDAVHVDGSPQTVYRKVIGMDARGNVTSEVLGNGVSTTNTFNAATGRLEKILSGGSAGNIQDLRYSWDTVGNLEYRHEYSGSKSLEESFDYDNLNRLISQHVVGETAVTVEYDDQHLGNIKFKSDVGTYSYGAGSAGPHAVTSAGGGTYTYDANGNNLTGNGRTIKYTTFDKPFEISTSAHTTSFAYGPDRARYKRIDVGTSGTTTTRYIGNVEIIERPDGKTEKKRYVAGIAIETQHFTASNASAGTEIAYLHKDHLGSIDVITDRSGLILAELSFDAWGERRNASNWVPLTTAQLLGFNSSITTRGYTGHEMLDEVGIIHMNGRIYDPTLARFLQADPHVQDAFNTQSLNRYSYVLNNPLNATDPTGFFLDKLFKSLNKLFGKLAPFIGLILLAIPGVGAWAAASWQNAFTFGFWTGGISSGSLRGAISGGLSGAAFYGIGQKFTETSGFFKEGGLGHIGSHATAGGVFSVLDGGKFGHGFFSAGLTKAANINKMMPGSNPRLDIQRTIVAAVVGGTISELTGGKFRNGAITAGFAQAFNGNSAERRRAEQERRSMLQWLDDKILEFFIEHDLQSLDQDVVDGFTGFGDGAYSAITFGIGDLAEVRGALGIDGAIDYESSTYGRAQMAGGITGGAAWGGVIGIWGRGRAGWNYSHFVPQRFLNYFGISRKWTPAYNGTYVPRWFHAATDAKSYRFIPASTKAIFGRTSPVPQGLQQVLRVPPMYWGGAIGSTVGD